ncbi:hypothetical protein [Micromonospora sp. NPDC049679]|uniref:hypothetical protein n=1 Tax=Micromonospora sp. NPDC049679 TaxID=3155920 RepID=UPI0034083C1C
MSLRSKLVLPDEMRGKSGPTKRPVRAPRSVRTRHPHEGRSYRQGFLLGMSVGMSLALVLGVVAFIVTRSGVASVPAPAAASATGRPTEQNRQPQAAIDVTARHLGNLQVQIEAQVSSPGSYDPITMGQVAAYTDMVAMPMSHRQGPIMMAESGGRRGLYQAVTTLPMTGEYDIMIEVKQPMAARAHKRIKVDTVAAS